MTDCSRGIPSTAEEMRKVVLDIIDDRIKAYQFLTPDLTDKETLEHHACRVDALQILRGDIENIIVNNCVSGDFVKHVVYTFSEVFFDERGGKINFDTPEFYQEVANRLCDYGK